MQEDSEVNTVLGKIYSLSDDADRELLLRAYNYAQSMHAGQKRASGDPFFIHPCAVAEILLDLDLDAPTIAAAFLHDVIEDTPATKDDIRANFGDEVMGLVEGVTKLEKIQYGSKEDEDAENFRKVFVAMANDVRVIIIKLADRLHNMRSLNYLSKARQQRIAKETLDIYAPLAGRLGIFQIKSELEDLCLRYLDPEMFEYLVTNIHQQMKEREEFVNFVVGELQEILRESDISGEVIGRPKHFYSIYRKMKTQNKTLDQIYDLTGVRVIVSTTEECYEVLGKIHLKWKPVPGRFKDYIATPKRNMYQSLHTTVVTNFGQFFEIQIRTAEMHRLDEYGIAAHWKYKENKTDENNFDLRIDWIRDILDWEGSINDTKEFVDSLKSDLYSSELLVFTPQGKVISLPLEATPIDFAYAIHSEVGHRCVGAKVNNKIVPLNSELHTGDVVEILTSSSDKGPSWDWLKFVKSGSARAKIRQYFKKEMKEENVKTGRTMLEEEAKRRGYKLSELLNDDSFKRLSNRLVFTGVDEMYSSVGYGAVGVNQVINRLIDYRKKENPMPTDVTDIEKVKKTPEGSVTVQGEEQLLVKFAHCCNPVPGDEIIGYVSVGRGVIIHRKDCPNIKGYNPERLQPAKWTGETEEGFQTELKVLTTNDDGVIAFITAEIARMKLSITQLNGRVTKEGGGVIDVFLMLRKRSDMDVLITNLKKDRRILDVFRTVN
ncbi:MAG: bifunctional (p)ppGpp synthetase/guanosine-3',5'-bis(diphosphate) 3'-pyrophosphohydrolase [Clostridia bacterium]|nr:bifunctional (p)ppGpp synthetase/guanosine-3',5'-bis(diphosphate) 3'-pyrophosphohydrolase [Clostridia bacterium]